VVLILHEAASQQSPWYVVETEQELVTAWSDYLHCCLPFYPREHRVVRRARSLELMRDRGGHADAGGATDLFLLDPGRRRPDLPLLAPGCELAFPDLRHHQVVSCSRGSTAVCPSHQRKHETGAATKKNKARPPVVERGDSRRREIRRLRRGRQSGRREGTRSGGTKSWVDRWGRGRLRVVIGMVLGAKETAVTAALVC
jgi:hypothetical protein